VEDYLPPFEPDAPQIVEKLQLMNFLETIFDRLSKTPTGCAAGGSRRPAGAHHLRHLLDAIRRARLFLHITASARGSLRPAGPQQHRVVAIDLRSWRKGSLPFRCMRGNRLKSW